MVLLKGILWVNEGECKGSSDGDLAAAMLVETWNGGGGDEVGSRLNMEGRHTSGLIRHIYWGLQFTEYKWSQRVSEGKAPHLIRAEVADKMTTGLELGMSACEAVGKRASQALPIISISNTTRRRKERSWDYYEPVEPTRTSMRHRGKRLNRQSF